MAFLKAEGKRSGRGGCEAVAGALPGTPVRPYCSEPLRGCSDQAARLCIPVCAQRPLAQAQAAHAHSTAYVRQATVLHSQHLL